MATAALQERPALAVAVLRIDNHGILDLTSIIEKYVGIKTRQEADVMHLGANNYCIIINVPPEKLEAVLCSFVENISALVGNAVKAEAAVVRYDTRKPEAELYKAACGRLRSL